MSPEIQSVKAEEILDSRGIPTLQVKIELHSCSGSFSVPSGASTGQYEAHELRDGESEHYGGKGVKKAINNVNEVISKVLIGKDVTDQKTIDNIMIELDGTENKTNLGANAIVGVSIACAKTAAKFAGKEVYKYLLTLADIKPSRKTPLLYMNLINGGAHAASKLRFQEYHVVPQVDSIDEALEIGSEIHQELQKIIIKELGPQSANVGNEGGYVLDTESVYLPFDLIKKAAEFTGHIEKIKFGLDVAASTFYKEGFYEANEKKYSNKELLELYIDLTSKYDIISIEDPFEENDFDSFANMMDELELIVVGDDLTVTNMKRLQMAIDSKSINGIIIKPNQIGTLSETLNTMKLARDNGIDCIVSHRSGETNDDFVADLAFAFGAFGIKAGAPTRGERVAKLNRLKHIEIIN
jgi:enolase